MSFVQERKSIEGRLRDNMDSDIYPVQYENVSTLKKGTTTIKDINETDKFVRLTITGVDAAQIDIGGSADRFTGIITLGLFVKANKGTNLARKMADELFHIYNRQAFDGICCRNTSYQNAGTDEDGWYQINLVTEYYRDEKFIIPVQIR